MIHQWCEHTVLAPELSFSQPFVDALPGHAASVNGSLPCCYCWSPLVCRCSRVRPCPISLRRSRNTPCQNIQAQPKQARVRHCGHLHIDIAAQRSPREAEGRGTGSADGGGGGTGREQEWRRNVRRWAVSFPPKDGGQKMEQKI